MTDTPAKRDFFISYGTPDGAWAEWIAWILEENGHTVHLQAWDFVPGKSFVMEMNRGATECDRTIDKITLSLRELLRSRLSSVLRSPSVGLNVAGESHELKSIHNQMYS